MSVGKDLLLEELNAIAEPSLEEQFEEALANEEERDRRHDASVAERRKKIRLMVDNT